MSARTASRLAWGLSALSATALVVAMVVSALHHDGSDVFDTFGVAAALTFPLVGGLLASRRPDNAIGWLLTATGLSFGVAVLSQAYSKYALVERPELLLGDVAAWVGTWIWIPGTVVLFVFMLLLFPQGRLPSRRWRLVAWIAGLTVALGVIPVAIAAWPIRGPLLLQIGDNPPAAAPESFKLAFNLQVLAVLLTFVLGLLSAVSLVLRFRRSAGEERQQLKWFAFGGSFVVIGFILNSPLFHIGGRVLPVLLVPVLPGALGIAILKYRLYDIDFVINKTVVYGALAGFISAVYVGIVVGIGTFVGQGDRPNLALSILATAVVAVAFQPVRERVQRIANRLVYGVRATPYEVLSHFAERMSSTYATDDLLPQMVAILGEGTGAARAEVWLRVGGNLRRVASSPPADSAMTAELALSGDEISEIPGAHRSVPVRHQRELLGALAIAKGPGEPVTPGRSSASLRRA